MREPVWPYQLKRSPYSSHSVLMRLFPEQGNGATVLDAGIPAADVLEHFRRHDLLLQQLRAVMKPGGRLIASVRIAVISISASTFCSAVSRSTIPGCSTGRMSAFTCSTGGATSDGRGFRIDWLGATGIPCSSVFPRQAESIMVRAADRISYDLARLWKTLF